MTTYRVLVGASHGPDLITLDRWQPLSIDGSHLLGPPGVAANEVRQRTSVSVSHAGKAHSEPFYTNGIPCSMSFTAARASSPQSSHLSRTTRLTVPLEAGPGEAEWVTRAGVVDGESVQVTWPLPPAMAGAARGHVRPWSRSACTPWGTCEGEFATLLIARSRTYGPKRP